MDSNDTQTAVVPSKNWLVRAYFTPFRDMLRGSLSARLDARREIVAASLPVPLDAVVWRVVSGTRLWRSEQVDVARELVVHFADGLSATRSPEQLVADFGNTRTAARLIRKAKLRSRPLWWQGLRISWRTTQVILVISILVYAVWSLQFYTGRPVVAKNYWHEVNAARRADEADCAWPIYREAIVKMVGLPGAYYSWQHVRPGDADWDHFASHIELNQPPIKLALAAAKKPRLGAYLNEAAQESDWISLGMDYVVQFKVLHRFLLADARVAAVEGQADRAWEDIAAAISMAQHLQQPKSMPVEQLTASEIFRSALLVTGGILADEPELFSPEQLRDLAHVIAAYCDGQNSFATDQQNLQFADFLQRAYTDNGRGDGSITPEGLRRLERSAESVVLGLDDALQQQAAYDKSSEVAGDLLSPGVAALIGSRMDNQVLYDSLVAQSRTAHNGPPWEWEPASCNAADQRLAKLAASPVDRLKYRPTILFFGAASGFYQTRELEIQLRDATQVAIALVLWHRRHGEWPQSLEELVPAMLPAVPPDRMDGQPLRYTLRDGQPLVYSIGMDRDDDGGRDALSSVDPMPYHTITPLTNEQQASAPNGDWILWPPSAQPKEEPPASY
jgi:hypothetical protein